MFSSCVFIFIDFVLWSLARPVTMKYMSEHSDEWPEYGSSGTSTARKDAADASLRSTAARAHSVALHESPAGV